MWQLYSIDPLNMERYNLRRRCGCEPHQVPAREMRMSTIIDPLCMRYLRYSLPNILESKVIPKNFTEETLDTGDS